MTDSAETELTRKQKQEERIVRKVLRLMEGQDGSSSNLRPEELDNFVSFMNSARIVAASALLAALLAAIYEYLALMGVSAVSPARAVLACAWFFGAMFVWEITTLFRWSRKAKRVAIVAAVLTIGACFLAVDDLTMKWKLRHPPEIVGLTDEVHSLSVSVQRLTPSKVDSSQHSDGAQPEIKEIRPVPGYLQFETTYPRLPLEQPNKSALVDVYYINEGSTYVHDANMAGGLFYVDFHGVVPPSRYAPIAKQLKEGISHRDLSQKDDLAPGTWVWSSLQTSDVLTEQMVQNIQLGTARIYLAAVADWTSNGGVPDHATTCLWLQPYTWSRPAPDLPAPDPSKAHPVWHDC